MGWTSYYVGSGCDRKAECMKYLAGYKKDGKPTVNVLKTVMKGSTFYALLETVEKKEQWVLCLLTSISKGEFYYKDIQCNPYESGVPMSILKAFKPSNDKDKEWLEKCLKAEADKKKIVSDFKIGDIVKCTNGNYSIEWYGGKKIKENETFYVRVETKNPFAKRKTKMYRLVELTDMVESVKGITDLSEKEILEKLNGKRYKFYDTNCRLLEKTFKNLPNRELVEKL